MSESNVEYPPRYGARFKQLYGTLSRDKALQESIEQIQKTNPDVTFESLANTLTETIFEHDFNMFQVLREQFSLEKAVELYAEIWARFGEKGMEEVKERLKVDKVDMPTFLEIMKIWYEEWGDPFEIVECSPSRCVVHNLRCPFTEFGWRLYGRKSRDIDFWKKAQPASDLALFNRMLKKWGLDQFELVVTKQLCMGDEVCEYVIKKKA